MARSPSAAEVRGWSIAAVRQWAVETVRMKPQHADVLHEQEIDGEALLDVISEEKLMKVGIPLGPAGKIMLAVNAIRGYAPIEAAASGAGATAASSYAAAVPTSEALLAALVKKVENLSVVTMSMLRPAASPDSLSHLGMSTMQTLNTMGAVTIFSAAAGEAVLTEAAQSSLAGLPKEVEVVAFLSSALARLRPISEPSDDACPRILVNSEFLPWLQHPSVPNRPSARLKPDLFGSWAPFIFFRDRSSPLQQADGCFGTLASQNLQQQGCVAEFFEGKKGRLSDAQFGDLCQYHRCVSGVVHGMLFSDLEFWLYKSCDGAPMSLVKCPSWTVPGSADLIRRFFAGVREPLLATVLRRLMSALGVRAHSSAFLGSGASGSVFAVRSAAGDGPLLALKVVCTTDSTSVTREFLALASAATAGAAVLPPVADSLTLCTGGAGYLLSAVGRQYEVSSRARCAAAFRALATLHERGIIHGDPRLPNLLLLADEAGGERAVWIDLYSATDLTAAGAPFSALSGADALQLVHSILSVQDRADVPPAVVDATRAYSAAPAAVEAAEALAAAVWAAAAQSNSSELLH